MKARPCESCGAAVYDLANDRTHKLAPIDAMPVVHGGNVRIDLGAGTYHVLTKAERSDRMLDAAPAPLHHSHFFTCPNATAWRRR